MTQKNTAQERKDLRELKEGQALFYKELVAKKYDNEKVVNVADTLEFDEVIFPIETQRRIVTRSFCFGQSIGGKQRNSRGSTNRRIVGR